MASIREKKDKSGRIISYEIRVYKGRDIYGKQLKPFVRTYTPKDGMTAKQIEKELNKQAVQFEEQCKTGLVADNRQTFAQYAEYALALKERTGVKHRTVARYRELLIRVNEEIGHLKLCEIKPQHLNNLYEQLSKDGIRKNCNKGLCKVDLKAMVKQAGYTQDEFCKLSCVSLQTFKSACNHQNILFTKAEAISKALCEPVKALFEIIIVNKPLSSKTVAEHHRVISTILTQADKEMLIPFNPASKATPPRVTMKKANYFQPEDIENIREFLEKESLKWKTIIHLLLITGSRRGELCGLKWEEIDWRNHQIHICRNLLYTKDRGVFEDTTKNESSDRYITLPEETMELLKEYRKWFMERSGMYGDKWHNTNYIFFQEKEGSIGKPINPDSITGWCRKFSDRNNLPHINPHAFRHTMASLLYFNGADSISISKRLGHSKVSTTTDIYSHIIKKADEENAELIADAIFRKKRINA